EGHRPDGARVTLECFQIDYPILSPLNSPQPDALVITTASEQRPIGVKDDGSNPAGVTLKCAQALPCAHVPQLDGMITPAASEQRPIGAEGHRRDRPPVVLDRCGSRH